MMQTFLTIIATMILTSFLTMAFMVGGIEYLLEKYDINKKSNKKDKSDLL